MTEERNILVKLVAAETESDRYRDLYWVNRDQLEDLVEACVDNVFEMSSGIEMIENCLGDGEFTLHVAWEDWDDVVGFFEHWGLLYKVYDPTKPL